MKMIPYKCAAMAAAVCVALAGAPVYAAGTEPSAAAPTGEHRMHREGREAKDDIFKDLNLTQEQRDRLKADREKQKNAMQAIHDGMRKARTDLKAELEKPAVDKARIDAIAAELKSFSDRMVDLRIASLLSLKEILTPEQFKKMHDKMEERKGMHGKWGGGKKDMPPPPPDDMQ